MMPGLPRNLQPILTYPEISSLFKENVMRRGEFIFTVILIIGGAAGLVYSLLLPSHGTIALSPGLFPGVVSSLLLILNSIYLFSGLKKNNSPQGKKEGVNRSLLLILSFFPGYFLLLYYFHFIISSFIFLVLTMTVLYKKFYWKTLVSSGLTIVVVYYLFSSILNVQLP